MRGDSASNYKTDVQFKSKFACCWGNWHTSYTSSTPQDNVEPFSRVITTLVYFYTSGFEVTWFLWCTLWLVHFWFSRWLLSVVLDETPQEWLFYTCILNWCSRCSRYLSSLFSSIEESTWKTIDKEEDCHSPSYNVTNDSRERHQRAQDQTSQLNSAFRA